MLSRRLKREIDSRFPSEQGSARRTPGSDLLRHHALVPAPPAAPAQAAGDPGHHGLTRCRSADRTPTGDDAPTRTSRPRLAGVRSLARAAREPAQRGPPGARRAVRRRPPPGSTGPLRVLDAGCGQGTQALRLAALGHHVVGVDPDERMLDAFGAALAAEVPAVRGRVRLCDGRVEDLPQLLEPGVVRRRALPRRAHVRPDPVPLVARAGRDGLTGRDRERPRPQPGRHRPAGRASRPLGRGAGRAGGRPRVHERARRRGSRGHRARPHRGVEATGLELLAWYGVRVLSDMSTLDVDPPPPGSDELGDPAGCRGAGRPERPVPAGGAAVPGDRRGFGDPLGRAYIAPS